MRSMVKNSFGYRMKSAASWLQILKLSKLKRDNTNGQEVFP